MDKLLNPSLEGAVASRAKFRESASFLPLESKRSNTKSRRIKSFTWGGVFLFAPLFSCYARGRVRVLAVGQGCSRTHNGTRDGFKNSDRKHLPRVVRALTLARMRLGLTGFINIIGSGSYDLNMLA